MNWDDAVKAHAAWKMRLLAYIHDPSKRLDPAVVGADDLCPFGIWLHGEGKQKLAAMPEFETLTAEHARFHRAVGRAVELANAGKIVPDQTVLGWESEFAGSSRNLVTTIVKLKLKVPGL
ncbi:MAG: CZB domain-containing protein [Rhodomicrobium sp.]